MRTFASGWIVVALLGLLFVSAGCGGGSVITVLTFPKLENPSGTKAIFFPPRFEGKAMGVLEVFDGDFFGFLSPSGYENKGSLAGSSFVHSKDGLTWTEYDMKLDDFVVRDVIVNSEQEIIAVGRYARYRSGSPAGAVAVGRVGSGWRIVWDAPFPLGSINRYGNQYVAFGRTNTDSVIATSPDGYDWRFTEIKNSLPIYSSAANSKAVVAVDTFDLFVFRGEEWQRYSRRELALPVSVPRIVVINDVFYLVDYSTNAVYVSGDGTSWSNYEVSDISLIDLFQLNKQLTALLQPKADTPGGDPTSADPDLTFPFTWEKERHILKYFNENERDWSEGEEIIGIHDYGPAPDCREAQCVVVNNSRILVQF